MELKIGTKYNIRDGGTDTIVRNRTSAQYPFEGESGIVYGDGGRYFSSGVPDPRDLISEYVEPTSVCEVCLNKPQLTPCPKCCPPIALPSSWGMGERTKFPAAEATITTDYQRGINAAVLWLVANYAELKPEYLAENMLKELSDD